MCLARRVHHAALGLVEIRQAWAGTPAGAPRQSYGTGAEAAVHDRHAEMTGAPPQPATVTEETRRRGDGLQQSYAHDERCTYRLHRHHGPVRRRRIPAAAASVRRSRRHGIRCRRLPLRQQSLRVRTGRRRRRVPTSPSPPRAPLGQG